MNAFRDLSDILVCPACKGELQEQQQRLACLACHRSFDQPSGDYVNLMLEDDGSGSRWLDRQQETYVWYQESLIEDREEAQTTFTRDYKPFARLLSSMTGI